MKLIITDSGLGGLSICAGVEQAFRARRGVQLTYVNAWPEEGRGYNDLPDLGARARAFDRVLERIAELSPDALLIACNTLSIVYEATPFSRTPPFPVRGIVNAGVDLFRQSLLSTSGSAVVLLGTRTTIESGVHRSRLLEAGIDPRHVGAVACHGLAAAIERGAGTPETAVAIEECARRAASGAPDGDPLYAGLCCTHYALASDAICQALCRHAGRPVLPLDPNARMVQEVVVEFGTSSEAETTAGAARVKIISKVTLGESSRTGIAALVEAVSPATAAALREYSHVPDFF